MEILLVHHPVGWPEDDFRLSIEDCTLICLFCFLGFSILSCPILIPFAGEFYFDVGCIVFIPLCFDVSTDPTLEATINDVDHEIFHWINNFEAI